MVRALVTGGSRGIGFEVARALIAKGFETTILGQNSESVARASAQLGATGVPFFVFDMKYGISGAQPQEVFTQTLAEAWNSHSAINI